jgi:hypothetical protein
VGWCPIDPEQLAMDRVQVVQFMELIHRGFRRVSPPSRGIFRTKGGQFEY